MVVPEDGFIVICANDIDAEDTFKNAVLCDVTGGANTPTSKDKVAVIYNGTVVVVDRYGNPANNASPSSSDFTDGRAVRSMIID